MTTTTTTTTPARSYDLAAIMGRAWTIRQEAAASMLCPVGDVLMGECLRLAWAEAEGLHAADNAAQLAADWGGMDPADQVRMITACVRKAAKNWIGYSTEDHYLQYAEVPAYYLHGHEFDELVNEAWIRVASKLADLDKLTAENERRAAQGKRPRSLVSLVYLAARAAIEAAFYADAKHSAACVREVIDADGEAAAYVETMAAARAARTEASAVIRATVRDYARHGDKTDRLILELLPLGYTEREIAKHAGMSCVAIHKRIVKMRAALDDLRGYLDSATA